MDTKDIINSLNDLIQLDADAVHAYEQAIERIDVPMIASRLDEFKTDHQRHISELSVAVRDLGGEPVEPSQDFKGFLIEGFTALRSVTGTEGALKAMKSNEELTNRKYEKALEAQLPDDIHELVQRNREDERRHLTYIEQALSERRWETGREAPSPM